MDFSVVVLGRSKGYNKSNVLYPIQNQISSKKQGLGLKEPRSSHGIRKEAIWGVVLLDPSWITFDDLGLAEILAVPRWATFKNGNGIRGVEPARLSHR